MHTDLQHLAVGVAKTCGLRIMQILPATDELGAQIRFDRGVGVRWSPLRRDHPYRLFIGGETLPHTVGDYETTHELIAAIQAAIRLG